MPTINIVGAGLAGSISARLLERKGFKIRLFDNLETYGASRNSENLFSMGWKNKLGEEMTRGGISILKREYNMQSMAFKTKVRFDNVFHIHPRDILMPPEIKEKVIAVSELGVKTQNMEFDGPVILAAGAWCNELLKGAPMVDSLTGHALLFKGTWEGPPIMEIHAPYRHLKIFQWAPNKIWFGDSTCILDKNYKAKQPIYLERTLSLAKKYGFSDSPEFVFGKRPWVKGQRGHLSKVSENVWLLTGGWKCGLVIYAYLANKLAEEISCLYR